MFLLLLPQDLMIRYFHLLHGCLLERETLLDANLLRQALEITLIDQAHQCVLPPSGDAIIDLVNQLGYPGEIHFVLRMAFIPKGDIDEVFGMQIPKELITNNIRKAHYYNAYLEMVANHKQKIAAEKEGGKKKTAPKTDKPLKPAPAKQAKPAPTKQPKPNPAKGQAHVGGVAIREPVAEVARPLPVVEGKGKAIATEEQADQSLLALHTPKRRSTTDQFIFQRWTPATKEASTGPSAQPQDDTSANIIRETPSPVDAETAKLDEGQAGSDPSKTPESRPPLDDDKMDEDHAGSDLGKSHVAFAGPNPEPMHDDFVATVYPKVRESLKFLANEQVVLENPPSSLGTLSSMKILDDTYTFGDQFFNDKSTKDEPGKQNVDVEVVSIVTVPVHQASTSVPPLSTPIIDLLPPKPVDSPHLEPFIVATTETTTITLPLPPPPQQQTTTDSELRAAEANIKEILHQWMFESGFYKSFPEHVALYEALEAFMERANRDEFPAKKDKSQKRHRDDQDPPPPPPDSDLNKAKRHDSDASGSKQPPAS
uniref:Histone deacetylase 14 n=1 Tax=Tanacetum cinerariifolium TaxID=118510 RepID=A0A6L2JH22_TANCI|nr:histone deacetylase 14 [Tanacetum cinerariifolium]